MINRTPYYYKDFNCIADKCTDTCCAGWEIVIDDESLDKYKNLEGDFGDRLRSSLTKYSDGESGFTLKHDNCPFLNKTGLCDIYSNVGKDYLCYTCRQFPRFTEEYGSLRETGISISCVEAARLILKDEKKVTFDEVKDDTFVSEPNEILPELYISILPCRSFLIQLMQNRNISLKNRISLLLLFVDEVQQLVDNDNFDQIKDIISKYKDDNYIKNLLKENTYIHNTRKLIKEYFTIYNELEPINEGWPAIMDHASSVLFDDLSEEEYYLIHNEFEECIKCREYEFEHLFVYFIFRYFLQCLYDYDLSSKIKFAAVSYLIIRELDIVRYVDNNKSFTLEDQIDVMHLYSKEIEHSEDNMIDLADMMNTKQSFTLDRLLSFFV